MEKTNVKYNAYIKILEEELRPAMGCTEPIALAYAAAVARKVLGELPDKVVIGASGSIIKNVKSVIVPNTDHLKGIPAAAAAGIVAGDPDKELEVIASVEKEAITEMKEFLEKTPISVEHVDNGFTFEIVVTLYKGEAWSRVRIVNFHTNIVLIEKNGEILKDLGLHQYCGCGGLKACAGSPDPLQHGHCRRGLKGQLRRKHRICAFSHER